MVPISNPHIKIMGNGNRLRPQPNRINSSEAVPLSPDNKKANMLITIALLVIAVVAITLGVLAYAKVGEMAKVGNLGASILCGGR